MAVRALGWASLAVALACVATACGTSNSTTNAAQAGPSGPETTLPRAEGALRLLARQGYAETSWVRPFERSTGCRVEVRYADTAEGLRRAADGWSFDVASIPGGLAYAVAEDGAARALNPDLVPERASFRAPFRDPAAGRAGARRYGVSFMWSPRLLIWRKSIRKHAPATWAPLSWKTKARRGRVALEDTPLQIGDAAVELRSLIPGLGIGDPYALDENQFAAAVALTKRRLRSGGRALAAAGRRDRRVRRRPRRRRRGRLVHGGADPRPERRRRPDAPARGRARRGRPLDARRPCTPPRLRVPLDALRLVGARAGSGGSLLRRDAGQPRRLRAARAGRLPCRRTLDAPARFLRKRIAFRHTPVENCGGGRRCVPFARWEQAWRDMRSG